ncbi:MAG: permease-like cell division protein FtsX [Acidimicrobiales bacterium]|nr:ABC transporter permease [Actinomycetes bacterium]MDP6106111.1 permease-like cell division protein FtsX [Acidimicrobiales bacterium]MDP7123804.1 permease-like cell division protein FtsX [Acidimicrobiales bacterium]MDP7352373.1 permease-like cell division protein FtsX [Acidimicrobiales bacterium]MDP7509131.1 permease-like cell division protein FtsX [Acidimicrobiales bacterium]
MYRLWYYLRETVLSIWRNLSLTLAAILTVAVSLALVGASMMIREGAERATAQFQEGVEFIVFMNPDADVEQDAAIRRVLDSSPSIAGYNYIDKAAAYDEFETLFADKPELVESVTPDVMPPSYRIVPTDRSAANVNELANQFAAQPGVREVATATEAIRQIDDFSTRVSQALLIAALVLVGVSALLILNTVFTAIGARKQEIEVMKLVGASNWFIRIPFMLEGTIHGLIGAAMAIPVLFVVDNEVMAFFQESDAVPLFRGFAVPEGFVWDTSIWLLILGGAVGMIGSAVAVTRYLDV